MVRLFFVYLTLFIVLLCVSSGVLASNAMAANLSGGKTVIARASLESLSSMDLKEISNGFLGYTVDPTLCKRSLPALTAEIKEFIAFRQSEIAKIKLATQAERAKLKEEHRSLMWTKTNMTSDELKDDYSKWAMQMYSNIGNQALVAQNEKVKIATWDQKNWLEIRGVSKNGQKYLTDILVHKAKTNAIPAVATN